MAGKHGRHRCSDAGAPTKDSFHSSFLTLGLSVTLHETRWTTLGVVEIIEVGHFKILPNSIGTSSLLMGSLEMVGFSRNAGSIARNEGHCSIDELQVVCPQPKMECTLRTACTAISQCQCRPSLGYAYQVQ